MEGGGAGTYGACPVVHPPPPRSPRPTLSTPNPDSLAPDALPEFKHINKGRKRNQQRFR